MADGASQKKKDALPLGEGNVLDVAEDKKESDEITMSTGVILKVKRVPLGVIMRVSGRFTRPKPPTYYNEVTKQEIENPDHPDYKAALGEYNVQSANAVQSALVLFGIEVVHVPKGIPKVKDNEWVSMLELTDLTVLPDDKHWRKLNWVLSVAAVTDKDYLLIQEEVGSRSGVSEEKVKSTEEFPESEEGG